MSKSWFGLLFSVISLQGMQKDFICPFRVKSLMDLAAKQIALKIPKDPNMLETAKKLFSGRADGALRSIALQYCLLNKGEQLEKIPLQIPCLCDLIDSKCTKFFAKRIKIKEGTEDFFILDLNNLKLKTLHRLSEIPFDKKDKLKRFWLFANNFSELRKNDFNDFTSWETILFEANVLLNMKAYENKTFLYQHKDA